MSKPEKTKYAVLGALTYSPMSGYDIKKWVSNVTGSFWVESPGHIYPTLAKMTKDGLIVCDASLGQGKRPKKVCKMTAKGREVLREWFAQPVDEMAQRNELRLKVFYGAHASKENCIHLLERQIVRMEEKLEHHAVAEKHIKAESEKGDDAFYWLLALKAGNAHAKAEIEWCKEAIRALKKKKAGK